MILELPEVAGQRDELRGQQRRGTGFGNHDLLLQRGRRKAEIDRDEALARGRFQAFQQVLVAGVVGHHQHELVRRVQFLTGALDRQNAPVVGQRVQHDRGVLARFHHFVQVADAALAHRARERTVRPYRLAVADQVAPHQVGCGQVVVARHRDQRTRQARRHVRDETRLAAAGRALDQERQAVAEGVFEQRALVADGLVEGDIQGGRQAGCGEVVHGISSVKFARIEKHSRSGLVPAAASQERPSARPRPRPAAP